MKKALEERAIVMAIPDDCKSIVLCANPAAFDEILKSGAVALHDDRRFSEGNSDPTPYFVAYLPSPDPLDLDRAVSQVWAKLRSG